MIDENFRAPLEQVTQATGGRLVRSSGLLREQMADLFGELQTYYSLGFAPPEDWQPGSSHDVEVRVTGRRLLVRHRQEVRLPEADEREAGATVAALLYESAQNPLGMRAIPGTPQPRDDGNLGLEVTLDLPVGKLGLIPRDGAHQGSLAIYVTAQHADGSTSRVQKIPFHLAIPEEKMSEARGESAHYPLPMIVRPDDRYLAVGVRDDVQGTFSAVRLDLSGLRTSP